MVRSDAETVSVDEPELLDWRFTVDGESVTVGFEGESPAVRLAGVTWADMPIPPENPLILVNFSVDVPEDPIGMESEVGFVVMLKSTMFTATLTKRVRFPQVAFTKTV